MRIGKLSKSIISRDNPVSLVNAARTAAAAVVSYLISRLFRLPEAYWAPIATLIVMQSSLGAALPISMQRFAGTVIGAAAGAVAATYFQGNVWAFGIVVFLTGLLCVALRVERSAYRYASITVAIIMLISRSTGAWQTAVHRFFEVSLGIAVGLVLSALWPERSPKNSDR